MNVKPKQLRRWVPGMLFSGEKERGGERKVHQQDLQLLAPLLLLLLLLGSTHCLLHG